MSIENKIRKLTTKILTRGEGGLAELNTFYRRPECTERSKIGTHVDSRNLVVSFEHFIFDSADEIGEHSQYLASHLDIKGHRQNNIAPANDFYRSVGDEKG